jgi:hypothetical protein
VPHPSDALLVGLDASRNELGLSAQAKLADESGKDGAG